MSTPNTTNEVRYKTGGATDGTYPIPFPFRSAETIFVFHYDVETSTTAATVNVDYTLKMQDSSGTVDPLADGTPAEKGYIKWINSTAPKDYIVVRRIETPKQEKVFDHKSGLDSIAIEGATDRIVQSSNLALKRESRSPDVYDARGLKIHSTDTSLESIDDGVNKKYIDDYMSIALPTVPTVPTDGNFWLGVKISGSDANPVWHKDRQVPTYSGSYPDFDVLKKAGVTYAFSDEPLVPVTAGISRGFTYSDSNTVSWNTFSEVPGLSSGETDDVLSNNTDNVTWRTTHESPLTGTAAGKPLSWNQINQTLFWGDTWSYGVVELSGINSDASTATSIHHFNRRWSHSVEHDLGYNPSLFFTMIQTEKIDVALHVNRYKTPTFIHYCSPHPSTPNTHFQVITMLLNIGSGGYDTDTSYNGPIHWNTNSLDIKFHWWAQE